MPRKALLIGIDDYPTQPLTCCVNDAVSMKAVLEQREFAFDCQLLLNSDATSRNIRVALEDTLKNGDEGSVVFFAGHGVATDFGTFLVTYDSNERPDDGLDMSLVARMIQAHTALSSCVLFLLDCCHSGALNLGFGSHAVAIRGEDLLPSVVSFSERRALIAGCKDTQLADEDYSDGHGVFTRCLLNGLMGDAVTDDGDITSNSLYDSVSRAFESNNYQKPVYRGDLAGRIVIGSGLISTAKKRQEDQVESVERLAREHLGGLQSHLAKVMGDRSLWHNEGFRTACKITAPVVEWFKKVKLENPRLIEREGFRAINEELSAKIRSLSNLEPGLIVECGTILQQIGSGSFGSVWKVQSQDQTVALKVFHGYDLGIGEKVSRFRHGFAAMKKLDHPRIIPVKQFFECPLSFSALLEVEWAITP